MKFTQTILILFLSTSMAVAGTKTWTGAVDNNWFNPSNWSGGVPTTGDIAIINNTANDPVFIGFDKVDQLDVKSGASFTVGSGSIFTIQSIPSRAVVNRGTINIGGILQMNTIYPIGGGVINYSGAKVEIFNGGKLSFAEVAGVSFRNDFGAELVNNGIINFNTVDQPFSGSGIISGNGTFQNTTVNGTSTFSPGSSPGKMTFEGGLALIDSGGYICELVSLTEHDTMTGSDISFGGTLTVQLAGYTPVIGDIFKIATCENCSGTFDSVSLPVISPELKWHVSYGTEVLMLSVQDTASIIWDGDVSGDWMEQGNWSGNSVPGPTKKVIIAPGQNEPTISAGMNVAIGTLEVLPCATFIVDLLGILSTNE